MANHQAIPGSPQRGYCLEPLTALDWKDLLPLTDAAGHDGPDRGYIQRWLEAQAREGGLQAGGAGIEAYQASSTVSELITGRNRAESSLLDRR